MAKAVGGWRPEPVNKKTSQGNKKCKDVLDE